MQINLPHEMQKQLGLYRRRRKEERGKAMTNHTAVLEILALALSGEESKPSAIDELRERVAQIERRLERDDEPVHEAIRRRN